MNMILTTKKEFTSQHDDDHLKLKYESYFFFTILSLIKAMAQTVLFVFERQIINKSKSINVDMKIIRYITSMHMILYIDAS